MDWQTGIAALFVTAAAAYLVRSGWRTWLNTKAGCGGGCSCSRSAQAPVPGGDSAAFVPANELTVRRRDGRPC
jgi:hypothetical protein